MSLRACATFSEQIILVFFISSKLAFNYGIKN